MGFKKVSDLISSDEKWYLGFGERLVWTPTHPTCMDCLGFWDASNFYDIRIYPNYTVHLFLDKSALPAKLKKVRSKWLPDLLISEYENHPIQLKETKSVVHDALVSDLQLKNELNKPLTVHLIAWGKVLNSDKVKIKRTESEGDLLLIEETRRRGNGNVVGLFRAFGMQGAESYQIQFSKDNLNLPEFEYTPFFDYFNGSLPNTIRVFEESGSIYYALHREVTLPPRRVTTVRVFMAFGLNQREVIERRKRIYGTSNLVEYVEKFWNDFSEGIPEFESTDRRFTRYYWYRWYGLKLFSLKRGEGNYKYPIVFEGPDYFRIHITYSAQCHMREMKWAYWDFAEGSLLNFVENQKPDGSFPGHVYFDGTFRNSFYHADWGKAALEVFSHTGNIDFLKKATYGLMKYSEYMDKFRDPEQTGMYDIFDHFETGQEFSRRYTVVDENVDTYEWRRNLKLKGIDVTVYMYNLKKTLAVFLKILGDEEKSARFQREAEFIADAVRSKMWDPNMEMFFDVNPKTGETTGVKAAVCFYPYMTDIPQKPHLEGFKKHLFNPNEFWTPYPVPTLSVDDPMFNPHAEWRGKRLSCPWNGRVWPMTNSHIAEAMGTTARRFRDETLRDKTVVFIEKFIDMLFFNDEPNSYEHYNPYNKRPSFYRGVNDYQHSWIVDLIFKYVVGLYFTDDGVLKFDPFPFKQDFSMRGLRIRDLILDVEKRGEKYEVFVNGSKFFEGYPEEGVTISKFF